MDTDKRVMDLCQRFLSNQITPEEFSQEVTNLNITIKETLDIFRETEKKKTVKTICICAMCLILIGAWSIWMQS